MRGAFTNGISAQLKCWVATFRAKCPEMAWIFYGEFLGKYTSPMDPMGIYIYIILFLITYISLLYI